VATVVRRDIGSPSKEGRRAFLRTGRQAAERQQYGKTGGGHAAWYRQTPAAPIPLSGETVLVTQAQQVRAPRCERL
jgi:hypothetical protein